ncbi:hypothetical protein BpHYR1_032584 [Brachionus plicatilis]|uniref:Uncharacterized protein n=1 Tax=Brachionus plicatilis TaxID=10195 RepID=A0A3M7QJU5_BRAPC|nr:hypothetical protein BpHYR1_032584 [Brachionus plicatilis]
MNDPSLKIEIKSQLYKTYCRLILTYGCEATKINQTLLRKKKSTESTTDFRKELNNNSLIVELNELLDDEQRSIEEIN